MQGARLVKVGNIGRKSKAALATFSLVAYACCMPLRVWPRSSDNLLHLAAKLPRAMGAGHEGNFSLLKKSC